MGRRKKCASCLWPYGRCYFLFIKKIKYIFLSVARPFNYKCTISMLRWEKPDENCNWVGKTAGGRGCIITPDTVHRVRIISLLNEAGAVAFGFYGATSGSLRQYIVFFVACERLSISICCKYSEQAATLCKWKISTHKPPAHQSTFHLHYVKVLSIFKKYLHAIHDCHD